jgi:hypothetical protein
MKGVLYVKVWHASDGAGMPDGGGWLYGCGLDIERFGKHRTLSNKQFLHLSLRLVAFI